jgi:neural Wiskott-Aldrich syndrome protein
VHTRRYTSPNRPLLQTTPQVIERDDPVLVRVEVPRTTFRIGEPIAVYITIPPPDINVIRGRGLRLRNVMAELVRIVSSGESQLAADARANDNPGASAASSITPSSSVHQLSDEKSDATYSPREPHGSLSTPDGSHTILTRSGSSCRFHTSRPVQVRLLLYPHQSAMHSGDDASSLSSSEQIENDNSDCTSITQTTLLHTVSFNIAVNATFMLAATHTEYLTRINVPIVLLPNPAPLPEVDESVASAYRKKHDKPPARTVRHEDADVAENEAGPSVSGPVGAPPPFEERDAPPPFFASDPTASTSSRLPTFLESESDLGGHVPAFAPDDISQVSRHLGSTTYISIPGEGSEFGFSPDEQYDGISSSLDQSSSPPPSMANVSLDADVTEFANLVAQPEHALEALSLALEQPASEGGSVQASGHSEALPPPPPLLDDPSDPPPSIDVEEFRRPPVPSLNREQSPPPSTLPPPASRPDPSAAAIPQNTANTHAPPPYLQPTAHSEPEEPVARPPPYVDVLPETSR